MGIRVFRNNYRKEEHMSVLYYLLHRRKVESLKELAAHAVACHLSCDTDVDELDIPLILHQWVAGFLQTSTIMDIESDSYKSETSDEEEDMWMSPDAMDEDEEDDFGNTSS